MKHLRVTAWLVVLCTIAVARAVLASEADAEDEAWRVDTEDSSETELSLPAFPAAPHSTRTDLAARLNLAIEHDSDEQEESADPIARFRAELEEEEQSAADEEGIELHNTETVEEEEVVPVRFIARPKKKKSKAAKKPKAKKAKAAKPAKAPKRVALRGGDAAPSAAVASRVAAAQYLPYGAAPAGFDARTLPTGPLPVQPIASAADSYARAHVRPSALAQAVFQPIHNSERRFKGAESVRNLAASRNNYAWADARRESTYGYGNTLIGAPVNAAYYPPHWASPVPTPVAAAQPTGPTAFVESGAAVRQSMPRPYRPDLAPSNVPARNPAMDQYQSNYGAYTSNGAWPSAIAPPAAYYLPPDLVI